MKINNNTYKSFIKDFWHLFVIEFKFSFAPLRLLGNLFTVLVSCALALQSFFGNEIFNFMVAFFTGSLLMFTQRTMFLLSNITNVDRTNSLYILYKKEIISGVKLLVELFVFAFLVLIVGAIVLISMVAYKDLTIDTKIVPYFLFLMFSILALYALNYVTTKYLATLVTNHNYRRIIYALVPFLFIAPLIACVFLIQYMPSFNAYYYSHQIMFAFIPVVNFISIGTMHTDWLMAIMPNIYIIFFIGVIFKRFAKVEKENIV